jgi:predicted DsbA family dithiol-disulfide isomerase
MKIEIWSDIMCPFCYLGKRYLENAIQTLPYQNEIQIIWRSFELNPDIKYKENFTVTEYLAQQKQISTADVNRMQSKIVEQGKQIGINFQFDKTPVSNSHDAHKLIHVAQRQGKANELKEKLFQDYFSMGINVESREYLFQLAAEFQLDLSPWNNNPFESPELEEEVNQDVYNAHQVGARGVPFFVFNEAYSLSGAHPSETYIKILETVKLQFP